MPVTESSFPWCYGPVRPISAPIPNSSITNVLLPLFPSLYTHTPITTTISTSSYIQAYSCTLVGQWLLLSVFPLQLSFWRFYTRLLFPEHDMSQFGSCSAFFTVWSYFTLALDNMGNVKYCYQILKLKWTTWYLNPCFWFYGT